MGSMFTSFITTFAIHFGLPCALSAVLLVLLPLPENCRFMLGLVFEKRKVARPLVLEFP